MPYKTGLSAWLYFLKEKVYETWALFVLFSFFKFILFFLGGGWRGSNNSDNDFLCPSLQQPTLS